MPRNGAAGITHRSARVYVALSGGNAFKSNLPVNVGQFGQP